MALAESRETVIADCQAVQPTYLNGVPYFYDKVYRGLCEHGVQQTARRAEGDAGRRDRNVLRRRRGAARSSVRLLSRPRRAAAARLRPFGIVAGDHDFDADSITAAARAAGRFRASKCGSPTTAKF